MKAQKGKVTVKVKRTYLITFHGRTIGSYWNGFTSFRKAKKYFDDHIAGSEVSGVREFGILQRDIRDTHTELT